jgi:uncharacterized protein (DUF1800 family)
MARSFRRPLAVALLGVLALQFAASGREVAAVPNDDHAIAHALNRLAFGARLGDIERVKRIGLGAWIEQQLSPAKIDNSDLTTRLARLKTIELDSATVAREYFLPARQARRQRQLAAAKQDGVMNPKMDSMTPDAKPGPPMAAPVQGERQIVMELAEAKILRAVYSERQLEEVLVDFWFNHFNVFARKGQTGVYVGEYEREAIRPLVLGHFRELLGATAKHPAMLFYLDNWLSSDPNATPQPRARRQMQQQPPQRQRRGLNENYARELLELHTLGVDGGYTQQDIVEVARALTGWTLANGIDGGFRFTPALHDRGEKKVLGHTIRAGGGIEDGERVLDIVAAHPSTARHIATKLVRRFVNDEPPAALVDKVAATFTKTKGNLREVVRTLVTAPEFYAAEHRNAKVKTPLEFVVSGVRATGREVRETRQMLNALQQLGMAPYMCQPPTGYDDTAETWVSAGALVTRMNIAQQLTPQRAAEIGGPAFQRH